MIRLHIIGIIILGLAFTSGLKAQLSPGDLAAPHAHLEGMSNCTQCHVLGKKVSNEKCLDCHTELKNRVTQRKGYHASTEVAGKDCFSCHSDHHGRNFEMIRFDENSFKHNLTGYNLEGAHAKQECRNCHKKSFIEDAKIRKKEYTFLGLNQACLSCHEDTHQGTLTNDCFSCHDFNAFKPAPKFNHENSSFPLLGKHQEIECSDCHKSNTQNGKEFQQFAGIPHDNCTSCHTDVHNNRFGQNCVQCHSEVSFHDIRGVSNFNHGLTDYQLEGKHRYVDCKACHKTNYTDPLKHNNCVDCHSDYHDRQFVKAGEVTDCADCHTTEGFAGSLFTVEQHNTGSFQLSGAHLATPCFACHKKEQKWSFRNIGNHCADCHEDIHDPFLDKKYYPEATCESCHIEDRWSQINFNHSRTRFELAGVHLKTDCRDCHFQTGEQQFANMSMACISCHEDVHTGQFEEQGLTDCFACHAFDDWSAINFNHNNTLFKLDGEHENVACNKCHKPTLSLENNYIVYKIEDFRCETCHK